MATIRIFLLTCRRPLLLPRALASLRAQTFTDWTCELHNDAPEDDSPRRLIEAQADPRLTLHQHDRNWGPIASFNHAFAGGPEPFLALLEDDNWWEPEFLATALAALRAHPEANVVWANMRLWQEEDGGTWRDTGRTIWRVSPADPPRLFHWPQLLQLSTGLHSNGAMLCRAGASAAALVPRDTPFAIIEPVRERLLTGGWLLLPAPLAHFALTRRTARSADRVDWAQSQLLIAGSFLESVPLEAGNLAMLWDDFRRQVPAATPLLFQLALSGLRPWALLRFARPADWLRFLAGAARHPLLLARILRFRRDHAPLWRTLVAAARQRTAEERARRGGGIPAPGLLTKQLS